jgi:cell division protein FtsZ
MSDQKGADTKAGTETEAASKDLGGRDLAMKLSAHMAKIKVFGIGGGGVNAVNNMIRSGLQGVEFYAANTDAQALASSPAANKIFLGEETTRGLGAGADPDRGFSAAKESEETIRKALTGADMVFVTAGCGGGTGTLGSSVVAQVAKELGCLTVGVVTKPFLFEGKRRMKNAERGIEELSKHVDTLITIPNQRLLSVAGRNTTLLDTFRKADDILFQAVKGISDLILYEGHVNVDFADVRAVMSEMGMAMMGTGEAKGANRAIEAAQKAITSPLLEDISIHGARGVLINVTASPDITLPEVNEAAALIQEEAHDDANIIWGMVIDPKLEDSVRITVIATGFEAKPKLEAGLSGGALAGGMMKDGTASEKLDMPAFMRRGKDGGASVGASGATPSSAADVIKLRKVSVMGGESEEKFEIPTFLRRQAE